MNPTQFKKFLKSNEEATERAIQIHVNGKIDKVLAEFKKHAQDDKAFQDRAEPMLEVFEKNNITHATIKKDTGEIVFWAKSGTIIVIAIGGIWWFIKMILLK